MVIIGLLALLCLANLLLVFEKKLPSPANGRLDKVRAGDGVAVLYIQGSLSPQPVQSLLGDSGTESMLDQLRDFEHDKRVRALILRIDSPGGSVGASQELYAEILRFKKRTGIPVVASIADIGASGAYWIAMASDYIFANPGSLVGSIGVIVNGWDFTQVQKRYGIGMTTFKSVAHKDMLSGWRENTPEEKKLVQDMLLDIQSQFEEAVQAGRHLKPKAVHALADGRIFTGRQAMKANLVDGLGTIEDAIDYAAEKAGIAGQPSLISKPKPTLFDFFEGFRNMSFLKPGSEQQLPILQ